MENQMNVGYKNAQQVGQNPVNQPVMTPEGPKTNYLIIGGIVLACLMVLLHTRCATDILVFQDELYLMERANT